MRIWQRNYLLLAIIALQVSCSPQLAQPEPLVMQSHRFEKTDGAIKNPMKGWNVGQWDSNDESSVAFTYIPWRDFEPNDQDFTSAKIEGQWALDWHLNRKGPNDKHLILRVFCQWDGSETDKNKLACPAWLMQKVDLLTGKNTLGKGGGTVVDFNNPYFVEQAKQMIAALGQRFNNDPRIYAIQLGIIGYWGEWHAFQFKPEAGGQGYKLSNDTKQQILDAYKAAFPNKLLMGRYLDDPVLKSDNKVGFHNDYFWTGNSHNNAFEYNVGEKWKQGPIGGESPPGPNGSEFYLAGAGLQSIRRAHYSTMKIGAFYREPFDAHKHTQQYGLEREEYIKAHKQMGYNFQIEQALFPSSLPKGTKAVPLTVEINNIGIAPFYYDWDIELALLAQSADTPLQVIQSSQKLSSFLPGQTNTVTAELPIPVDNQGSYRLAIRIVQPDATTTKAIAWKLAARHTFIEFANQLTVVNANWGLDHALQGGWSVLGTINTLEK
jgi:hypothetical protein